MEGRRAGCLRALQLPKEVVMIEQRFDRVDFHAQPRQRFGCRDGEAIGISAVHNSWIVDLNVVIEKDLAGGPQAADERQDLPGDALLAVGVPPGPVVLDASRRLAHQVAVHPRLQLLEAVHGLRLQHLPDVLAPLPRVYLRRRLRLGPLVPAGLARPVGEAVQDQHGAFVVPVEGVHAVDAPVRYPRLRAVQGADVLDEVGEDGVSQLAEGVPFCFDPLVVRAKGAEQHRKWPA
mmetsp:Transcript_78094/g.215948  ORF Transcript_78094/g.215948 Transcript_78094/m.215948 type:complete len:234 (+) Transcript_78094:176-877(+)